MTTFTIEHVDVATPHSYEQATTHFVSFVPYADRTELAGLVAARASRAEVEAMMARRAGELGILIMAAVDQGPIVSLLGPPRKLAVYLIGSPVLGARLFERHRDAGLYAPAHVTLYEHEDGRAHLAYDRPSSLLAQLGAGDLAAAVDEKLARLAQLISSSQCS